MEHWWNNDPWEKGPVEISCACLNTYYLLVNYICSALSECRWSVRNDRHDKHLRQRGLKELTVNKSFHLSDCHTQIKHSHFVKVPFVVLPFKWIFSFSDSLAMIELLSCSSFSSYWIISWWEMRPCSSCVSSLWSTSSMSRSSTSCPGEKLVCAGLVSLSKFAAYY